MENESNSPFDIDNNIFNESYFLAILSNPNSNLNLTQDQISEILNNENKSNRINALYYILSKNNSNNENSNLLNYIKNNLQNSLNKLQSKNSILEKEINLNNFSKDLEKINKALNDNKETFKNYKNYTIDLTHKMNTIDNLFNLQKEIQSQKEDQNQIIISLNEFKKYKEDLKNSKNLNYSDKIDLYLKIKYFIEDFKNNLTDKDLINIINNFQNKNENLYSQIKEDFNNFINEEYFKISKDKQIILNNNTEKGIDKIMIQKTILNFPNFIIEILQKLYDNFISYFYNKNYKIIKSTEPNKTKFTLELIQDYKTETDENKLENFNKFLEIIKIITNFCIEIKNNSVNLLESEVTQNLIKYDILYGGSSKKTKNSFIFVFCYYIQQFYKNFKEEILDNFKNKNINSELDLENNMNRIIIEYKRICQIITENFESVKKFKFYDNNDYIYIENDEMIKSNKNFRKNFLNFRDHLKLSYYESKEMQIKQIKIIDLIEEIFEFKFNFYENNNFNEELKILNLNSIITISKNFQDFIKSLITYINTEYFIEENLSKIFSLFYTMYNNYSKLNENNFTEFSEVLLMHNNIEAFLIILQFLLIFNKNKLPIDYFRKVIIHFKNFSSNLINQIISNFIKELIGEISTIETFDDIRFDRNSQFAERLIKSSLDLIFKFFNLFKEFANEKDLLFYLNYIISLFFDILNRKILLVKDFNIDDTKVLAKISKIVSNDLKKNFEEILSFENVESKIEFENLLENNQKFKKFEEIVYVLNANMKEIKIFIVQSNFNIHIDPIELVDLIKAIFENNPNRETLIQFINEKLYKK